MQRGGGKIEPGDAGIWITCVKGKEGAATEELRGMFDEVCTIVTFLHHDAGLGTYYRIVRRIVLRHSSWCRK